MEDPEFAFTYICKCPWGTKRDGGDEDEDEDDEEDEEDGAEKPKCDLGKTCLCDKLAADHPEAPYVITRAAYRKLMNQQVNSQLQVGSEFGMIEDGESAMKTAKLIGNMFLAMLARLEREGVLKPDELLAEVNDKVKLPTAEEHGDDPWGFGAALEEYRKGGNSCGFFVNKGGIGGDSLDITSWTPAERKKASFNKKDPLPKKILDGIKDGLVIGLG
ncbi:hypothetical protein CSOJ01_01508 [Colletotrichum sojae]|uniref:Uncharacterized protein n=1 Tax=Colletotrichum sojae TaxID=2175907 RepID=A0A8H6N4C5_9PEZI|nr:hypothetical protein CSOJ01_01508 [Colletotrichum sojae]